jgi:hypothetical protein
VFYLLCSGLYDYYDLRFFDQYYLYNQQPSAQLRMYTYHIFHSLDILKNSEWSKFTKNSGLRPPFLCAKALAKAQARNRFSESKLVQKIKPSVAKAMEGEGGAGGTEVELLWGGFVKTDESEIDYFHWSRYCLNARIWRN